MRIAFSGDWHLGNRYGILATPEGINLREQDGYDAANEVVSQIIEQQPDIFVFGGDLFHTHHPSIRSIVEAQRIFQRLADAGIPSYVSGGNHDSSDFLSDVPAVASVAGNMIHVTNEFSNTYELQTGLRLSIVSHRGVEEIPNLLSPIAGDVNILSSHASVIENGLPLHTEDAPREKILGEATFDMPWNGILLGHIHNRHMVKGRKNVFYAGSTFRRGFADSEGSRGWTLVTVNPDGSLDFKNFNIHQRTQVDLGIFDAAQMNGKQIEDGVVSLVEGIEDKSIVRINIINCSPATRREISGKGLSEQRARMMHFEYSFSPLTKKEGKVELADQKVFGEEKIFDNWVSDNEMLKTLDESRKSEVISLSKKYVQRARNKKLSES